MDAQNTFDCLVLGGGAAGFFGAINLARTGKKVAILEKFHKVLTKLAVSGGGRCNVTHRPMDAKELIKYYPRGSKELLGPFHHFASAQMIEWLSCCGVALKEESDGRMFPITDSSQTMIDCFLLEAKKAHVALFTGTEVLDIIPSSSFIEVITSKGSYYSSTLLITTGSSKNIWTLLKKLGHTVVEPVPSLFALNTPGSLFNTLSGLSVAKATLSYKNHTFTGPLLFTHFGLSGPAALKLSSFAALDFSKQNYKSTLDLDMCPEYSETELLSIFNTPLKSLKSCNPQLPKRLWDKLLEIGAFNPELSTGHMAKADKLRLIKTLKNTKIFMDGKTTHKEEFVTAGGISLSEINFKTMQSKIDPRFYFAGEVLNIDGVTGGFNFQAAWTTSYLASLAIASRM